jgi:hypothetical protein
VTFLRNLPWGALYAAIAFALLALLVGVSGMAAVSIPVCWVALKLLAVAGGLLVFAAAAWFVLEGLGVL